MVGRCLLVLVQQVQPDDRVLSIFKVMFCYIVDFENPVLLEETFFFP